jgi:hypothetical protein
MLLMAKTLLAQRSFAIHSSWKFRVTIRFFQLFRWKQRIINKFGFDSILDKSLKSTSFSNDVKDLTWTLEFKLECVEGEMTMVA